MGEGIRVGVNGAAGRMGQRIVALVHNDSDLVVTAAYESAECPQIGQDAGQLAGIGDIGVPLVMEVIEHPDVIIDFSTPQAAAAMAEVCGERQISLISATTGLNQQQREAVLTAAQTAAVVMAPNLSLAVNLTMKLVQEAAQVLKTLPDGVDVEIIERHHRFKEDAPSGTALRFGQIISEEMGQTEHVHGRQGRPGPRPRTEIGYHALRTGDNVGEHTIVFGMMGETIDIDVRGHTRDSYAYGALVAAKFLITQGAGLYSMADVLGL